MTYRYGIMNTNALWPHIGTFLRQLDIPEFTIKLRLKLLPPGLWHYTLVWLAFSSFLSCFPHSFIIFPWSTLSLNHLCLMNFVSESDSKESNLRQWITQFPVGTNENNLATLQLHFDRHPCLSAISLVMRRRLQSTIIVFIKRKKEIGWFSLIYSSSLTF